MKKIDVMIQFQILLEPTRGQLETGKNLPLCTTLAFLCMFMAGKSCHCLLWSPLYLVCLHSCLLGPPLYFSLTSPFVHLQSSPTFGLSGSTSGMGRGCHSSTLDMQTNGGTQAVLINGQHLRTWFYFTVTYTY